MFCGYYESFFQMWSLFVYEILSGIQIFFLQRVLLLGLEEWIPGKKRPVFIRDFKIRYICTVSRRGWTFHRVKRS